jgi:hypothetical protein
MPHEIIFSPAAGRSRAQRDVVHLASTATHRMRGEK